MSQKNTSLILKGTAAFCASMRGVRLFVFAVSALSLALVVLGRPAFAASADNGITADQLLELKLAQAESLESLDSEIETTIDSNGSSVTTRSHIAFDKVAGTMQAQKLDEDGTVNVDMKVEGTNVSFRRGDGTWVSLPLDDQTRATLIEQGIEFPTVSTTSASKQAGLAGHGKMSKAKDPATRRLAKIQHMQKQLTRMKGLGRFQRMPDLDQDTPKDVMAGVDLNTPLGFEADGLLNGSAKTALPGKRVRTGKSRALLQSTGAVDAKTGKNKKALGFDAVFELIDEDSGVPVETSSFMKVERAKAILDVDGTGGAIEPSMAATDAQAKLGRHPFARAKTKLPGWARKMKDADGVDVVEMQRTRVLKLRRVGGNVLPEETEQVDLTAAGEVRQRTKWISKAGN